MKKFTPLLLSLVLSVGCSSVQRSWDPRDNDVTLKMHEDVLQELDRSSQRIPASTLSELYVSFNDLRKVSPGKFEVYVFPKVSSQTSKAVLDKEEYLGPPRIFEVSVQAVNPCKQFIKGNLFSNKRPAEAFAKELGDTTRDCAILEVRDRRLATMDKALLHQDDQLSVTLFIDDAYTLHAVDTVIYESPSKNRVVRRTNDEGDLSSGLSLFPMDLPTALATQDKKELSGHFKQLDGVAVYQIQKRYNQSFSVPKCDGMVFTAKDSLGGKSEVGWCKGVPWPSYSENRRFISVTQSLKVR